MSHGIVQTETKKSDIGALFIKRRFWCAKDMRLIFIPMKREN
jgi:hypothetical protein